jgi:hypothetical protein
LLRLSAARCSGALGRPTSTRREARSVTPSGFAQPYLCADASRHDYVDTTLGLRIGLYRWLVPSVGVFKALKDEGVRASDWSPVGAVEGTF